MKTKLEAAQDSLIVIESIASGSTTANSLPNLARIAREALNVIAAEGATQAGDALIEVLRKADDALRNSVVIVSGQQSWDRHNEARVALNKAIEELTHAR